MRSRHSMEKMREVADLLLGDRRYREAFTLYDELFHQVWGIFGMAQAELAHSGGLPAMEPWDPPQNRFWHVESTANILCARVHGIGLAATLQALAGIISGHLQCACAVQEISAGLPREQALVEFAALYLMLGAPHPPRKAAPLFALATAVVDKEHRLRWIRLNQPRLQVEKFLVNSVVAGQRTETRALARLLADYLIAVRETSSEFSRSILRAVGPRPGRSSRGPRDEGRHSRPGETWAGAPPFDPTGASEAEKKTHYGRLFGLRGTVSKSEIRSRYIESVALYHPDKVQHLGPELQDLAERKTKELNAAYDWFKHTYDL